MMRVTQSSLPGLRGVACTGRPGGEPGDQEEGIAVLQGRQAPRCSLAVLTDRLGGRSSDSLTAESIVLATQQCFDRFSPAEESPQSFFAALVDQVHTVLRLAAVASASMSRSSFAALLVQPDRVDWCHVGSTRIYHFRDGQLLHHTSDGAWPDDGPEVRDIAPGDESGHAAPGAPGEAATMDAPRPPAPAVGGISDPCSGDSFLLCSDGLWQALQPSAITEIVVTNGCRDAAALLMERAQQESPERARNCSLVLVTLDPAS